MGSVTSTGYVADRLDDIFSGLVTKFKSIYGDDILTDPDDPDGQIIGIFAQMRADVENVIELVYQANDPDNATGTWLEQKVAFAGLTRKGPSYSVIEDALLTGTAGTVIPSGSIVKDGTGNQWILQANVTLGEDGTAYSDFRSSDAGQFSVDAGVKLDIVTVIAGWSRAETTLAATPGENEETDPELLARFYKSRSRASSNCVDGTLADIAGITGVTDATALENETDTTDDNGVPAHTVNYIVEGGDNAEIAQAIYNNWPGTGLQGDIEVDVTRRSGKTATMRFDRPQYVDIAAVIKVGRRASFTYVDEEKIKEAVTGMEFSTGEYVYTSDVSEAVNAVSGVYVREILLSRKGDTPGETLAVTIGPREKARFQETDIDIQIIEEGASA
ncbi:baseplate J/gp47 family protein [Erwinia sp. HR93]|uniref:baseplate J/gp47 family protein n=1 Tax=Erwinia sp. HR93 TaxID=3094840 RepID=UPI002ADEC911|nr:baseplate J/gp47 family protein [Erwinia sp. HR93]MEA1064754.1 baseplate J/gp47 family protein [Erwinia sp. HR93]